MLCLEQDPGVSQFGATWPYCHQLHEVVMESKALCQKPLCPKKLLRRSSLVGTSRPHF